MYTSSSFIDSFLKNILDVPASAKWRARVLDYAAKFDEKGVDYVIEEIYCRVVNDLDTMEFPLCFRDVQKLEAMAAQLPLNKPMRVYQRMHLLHYIVFKESIRRNDA